MRVRTDPRRCPVAATRLHVTAMGSWIACAAFALATGTPALAQEPSIETEEMEELTLPPLRIVSGSFSHLNVLGTLDATYGGVSVDRIGDRYGFSGSLLVGRGSEGGVWVHLPVAGIAVGVAVIVPLALLQRFLDWEEAEEPWIPSFALEALMYENVHRNIWLDDRVLLAPYLGVLGLDGKEGSDVDGFMSLSSGVGLDVKLFVTDRFVVAPDVAVRHHWVLRDPTSDAGSRGGVTASIRAGFAF